MTFFLHIRRDTLRVSVDNFQSGHTQCAPTRLISDYKLFSTITSATRFAANGVAFALALIAISVSF